LCSAITMLSLLLLLLLLLLPRLHMDPQRPLLR
jgi:hypothetical protein